MTTPAKAAGDCREGRHLRHFSAMSKEIQEIAQTGAFLLAASRVVGRHCDDLNDQFIICKATHANPAFCVEQGKRVTSCSLSVYVSDLALQAAVVLDLTPLNFGALQL